MKNFSLKIATLFVILSLFTSCEAIGSIFKAGMGFGIFLVVAVIVVVLWLIFKMFGKK
ncbi:hypothetical protein [Flavobacterium sp. 7A]|uniref:hypothetical protein n=1 Tax=Flavobacterium sp. 7A TaxID=2940571 RepID=UPI0022263CB6|nr:hypothetical protein [Flavobacterium sp. 7A]MCW2118471.1 TRAP-type C4-dicarboxylate transport system permease large subunit [Flavobacterium sp. 7A]